MNNLSKNFLLRLIELKNKYPYIFILLLITPFILLGYFTYSTTLKLNKNEIKINTSQEQIIDDNIFEGRVIFNRIDNNKNIYDLISEDGEFIAELNADDEKLDLVDGLYVQLVGTISKANDESISIIKVDEIILKSNN